MSEDATQKLKKCYSKLWLVLLAIVIAVGAYWFWYEAPFKVKDPSDPRFNPDKFAYRDYYDEGEMRISEAYKILFPRGTPKAFVDRVLVQAGGASVSCFDKPKLCYYRRPARITDMKGGTKDLFLFGSDSVLISARHHKDFQNKLDELDQKTRGGL